MNSELYVQTMIEALKDSGIKEPETASDVVKLKAIFDGPYQAYCRVRELLSEEKWAYYTLMGIYGLREQVMLDEARKDLRSAWKAAFPKAKNDKDKGSGDSESQHPSGDAS